MEKRESNHWNCIKSWCLLQTVLLWKGFYLDFPFCIKPKYLLSVSMLLESCLSLAHLATAVSRLTSKAFWGATRASGRSWVQPLWVQWRDFFWWLQSEEPTAQLLMVSWKKSSFIPFFFIMDREVLHFISADKLSWDGKMLRREIPGTKLPCERREQTPEPLASPW